MTPPESWKGLEEAAEIEAGRARRKILDTLPEVQPEVLINEGDLWLNVADAIKENDIDLVVVERMDARESASFCLVRQPKRSLDRHPAQY